jgi:hypothetical protein
MARQSKSKSQNTPATSQRRSEGAVDEGEAADS